MSRRRKTGRRRSKAKQANSGLDYRRRKVLKRLEQGRPEDALRELERVFEADAPARALWLIEHWPARAAAELAECAVAPAGVVERLVAQCLSLAPELVAAVGALECLDPDLRCELVAISEASRLLAAGDDRGALASLRRVRRDSPLASAKRFLRGLLAVYNGDTAGVERALDGLDSRSHYHGALRSIGRGDHDAGLAAVAEELERGRPRAALVAAERLAMVEGDPLRPFLRRYAAGALVELDVCIDRTVAGVSRALGSLEGGAHDDHLLALLLEAEGYLEEATERWMKVAAAVGRGKYLGDADRGVVGGMIFNHLAERWVAVAPPDSFFAAHRFGGPSRAACLSRASLLFEQATDLDPAGESAWTNLIALAPDAAARGRLIERYVRSVPESPAAWARAAEAAEERGAFDKAMGHLKHALTLAPNDRALWDLEGRLLGGKARKHARAGSEQKALAAFERALALPRLTPTGRAHLHARVAAYHIGRGRPAEAARETEAACALAGEPWTVHADVLCGWSELFRSGRGRTPRAGVSATAPDTPPTPNTPPGRAELAGVLARARAHEERYRDRSPTHDPLRSLARRAVVAGIGWVETMDDVRDAYDVVYDDIETCLRLFERGAELRLNDSLFIPFRYEAAIAAGRPAGYFASALTELSGLRGDDESSEPHGRTGNPLLRTRLAVIEYLRTLAAAAETPATQLGLWG